MTNYVSIKQKKGEFLHHCKFNVSEDFERILLTSLKAHFPLELVQGSITRKNKRLVIEIKVTPLNAAIIRKAFISQLPIFENQN